MELLIRASNASPTRAVEMVERKGLGHPDTICDGVAEEISRALCKQYRDHFGIVLHHNVDKALLVGGNAHPQFGGGEVTEPMEIYLAGRATAEAEGKQIRVDEIAVEACRSWLRAHLPHVDLDRHVRITPRIRAGSSALTALFARDGKGPVANDTSCAVGFAPLSDLERTVLAVERELNSPAAKRECPGIGEDIKVMRVRSQDKVTLTIGCAVVAKHVLSIASYKEVKNVVRERAVAAASAHTSLPVEALVNAADDLARGDVFLTITGTSAESGDDGEVGRGNRVNGLITPYRPMTMEALVSPGLWGRRHVPFRDRGPGRYLSRRVGARAGSGSSSREHGPITSAASVSSCPACGCKPSASRSSLSRGRSSGLLGAGSCSAREPRWPILRCSRRSGT